MSLSSKVIGKGDASQQIDHGTLRCAALGFGDCRNRVPFCKDDWERGFRASGFFRSSALETLEMAHGLIRDLCKTDLLFVY